MKVIGEYPGTVGPLVTVRDGFDEETAALLTATFLQFSPEWEAVYGGYKPFYRADLQRWFHDLDQLPAEA